ncbi:unnamed protein product [Spirodela intermedia]|uniref:Uncharacterized protein n=2 Tax=Spirodela intermedia TaxID=51605 RepID=A0A7I8KMP8_SPIIN|nr:unnamed protein product [Spirodela intermedia]CAA6661981.1 unnamed protein product [Spirodela intermedia]CAA7398358.1 unnamed protein product [Spirodela intermedia]
MGRRTLRGRRGPCRPPPRSSSPTERQRRRPPSPGSPRGAGRRRPRSAISPSYSSPKR